MEHRSTSRDHHAAAGILAGGAAEYTSDRDGLDVSVLTGMYVGHCLAFPSLHLYISLHPFHLPENWQGSGNFKGICTLRFFLFPHGKPPESMKTYSVCCVFSQEKAMQQAIGYKML